LLLRDISVYWILSLVITTKMKDCWRSRIRWSRALYGC